MPQKLLNGFAADSEGLLSQSQTREIPARNRFDIPLNRDESMAGESHLNIENELATRLREEYSEHVKKAQE
ncbi:MAG TPA: hypothetical protein VHH35_14395 [Pyrinomonadaceae bacterium]|nr:hypothetical protein [Pyrinomonadaceae bacterium]